MTLPHIGASLNEGVLTKGRQTWKNAPTCARCNEPAFPRGVDLLTGLCWFCRFTVRAVR